METIVLMNAIVKSLKHVTQKQENVGNVMMDGLVQHARKVSLNSNLMDQLVQHAKKVSLNSNWVDGLVQNAKKVSLNSNVDRWVGPACQESKFKQ